MSRILLCSGVLLLLTASDASAQDASEKKAKVVPPSYRTAPKKPQPTSYRTSPYSSSPYDAPPKIRPMAKRPSAPKRQVYRARHVPAADLAKTVNEFLEVESQLRGDRSTPTAIIVPEPITNSLLISAAVDDLKPLIEWITTLDRKPSNVMLEVLIVRMGIDEESDKESAELFEKVTEESLDAVVAEFEKRGQPRAVARFVLTTLDNQAAFLQVGGRHPRVTGTVSSSSRGKANSVTLENVGLILGVTPRVNTQEGLVTMELDVEQSRLGPPEEGTILATSPEGEETRSPEIETAILQTTVLAADGEQVVLGGLADKQDEQWQGLLILLTPRILK